MHEQCAYLAYSRPRGLGLKAPACLMSSFLLLVAASSLKIFLISRLTGSCSIRPRIDLPSAALGVVKGTVVQMSEQIIE